MGGERETFVFDSFALLAHFEGEPGGPRVAEILSDAAQGQSVVYLSMINFGEVLYITKRERGTDAAHRVVAAVDQLPILVAGVDRTRTFAAASLKADYPIAYADAFALALAVELGATLVTGDPEFEKVDVAVSVEWLSR